MAPRETRGALTVSACLITCNGLDFVGDQVRSIFEQTSSPDELVVSDDASSDGTVELLEELTRSAPMRVRLLRNPQRLGVSANLQRAIEASTGEIVLFADQDDLWKPGKVARVTEEFDAHPDVELVFTDAELIDRGGQPLPGSLWQRVRFGPDEQTAMKGDGALQVMLRRNVVTGATVAVRRSLLRSALPFPAVGWHDHWLALYAAASGVRIWPIDARMLSYRLHGANAAGLPSHSPRQWMDEQATAWQRRQEIIGLLDELTSRLSVASDDVHGRVERAKAFLRHRQRLSRNPLARAWMISKWARRGDYGNFADGWRSVSVDLLLPQRSRLR